MEQINSGNMYQCLDYPDYKRPLQFYNRRAYSPSANQVGLEHAYEEDQEVASCCSLHCGLNVCTCSVTEHATPSEALSM